MRKVVLSFWISLDGYSVDEDTGLWQVLGAADDPEHEEYFVGWLRQAGTHIMGRVTYDGMAKTWPTSSEAVATPMNDIPKVVFSRTLESAGWPETRIARGDTAEEIAKLKAEPGGGRCCCHFCCHRCVWTYRDGQPRWEARDRQALADITAGA
jgi:dihydrofolate reductase